MCQTENKNESEETSTTKRYKDMTLSEKKDAFDKDQKLERNITIVAVILLIGGFGLGVNLIDSHTFFGIVSFLVAGMGGFWIWAIS